MTENDRTSEITIAVPADEYEREQARKLRAGIQRGHEHAESFETDFDREVFLHGSLGERVYHVRQTEAEDDTPAQVELVRGMSYGGNDRPSYG